MVHVTVVGCLMEGEMVMLPEVVSLMERQWSSYRGGQFNGGRMINMISG